LATRLAAEKGREGGRGGCLLADEENVDGAEVEVVEEREGSKTIVRRMLASIELWTKPVSAIMSRSTMDDVGHYHDGLALVLDNMARPPDLVSTS
jgi:hypothetical protein